MISCWSSVPQQTDPSPHPACLRKFSSTHSLVFRCCLSFLGSFQPRGSDMLTGTLMGSHSTGLVQIQQPSLGLPVVCMAFPLQISLGGFTLVPAVGSRCRCLRKNQLWYSCAIEEHPGIIVSVNLPCKAECQGQGASNSTVGSMGKSIWEPGAGACHGPCRVIMGKLQEQSPVLSLVRPALKCHPMKQGQQSQISNISV